MLAWLLRVLKGILAVVLAGLIAGGGYVAWVAIQSSRPVALPAAGGRYPVGRTTIEWTDRARTDPLAPRPGQPRALAVWLWYPAAAPGSPAVYLPGDWSGLQLPGETAADAVQVRSADSGAAAAGRFPLVVFLPSEGLAAPQYTTIAEDLAAHGYLVAGVTPTYSARLTVLSNKVVSGVKPASERLLPVLVADARFVSGQVATMRSGPLHGHVDGNRTIYAGHGLGGAAALQACHDDPHCKAAADLDGTPSGPAAGTKPVLSMGRVDGMRHLDFTDYDAFYVARPVRRWLGLGTLPRGRVLTIVDDRLTAFLAGVLGG
jgi:dienelactone hydrolase